MSSMFQPHYLVHFFKKDKGGSFKQFKLYKSGSEQKKKMTEKLLQIAYKAHFL